MVMPPCASPCLINSQRVLLKRLIICSHCPDRAKDIPYTGCVPTSFSSCDSEKFESIAHAKSTFSDGTTVPSFHLRSSASPRRRTTSVTSSSTKAARRAPGKQCTPAMMASCAVSGIVNLGGRYATKAPETCWASVGTSQRRCRKKGNIIRSLTNSLVHSLVHSLCSYNASTFPLFLTSSS